MNPPHIPEILDLSWISRYLGCIPEGVSGFGFGLAAVTGLLLLLPKAHPDAPIRLGLAGPTELLAGLFGGLAAMPGPPVVAYYLSGAIPSSVMRATMMVFFFTSLLALPGVALSRSSWKPSRRGRALDRRKMRLPDVVE